MTRNQYAARQHRAEVAAAVRRIGIPPKPIGCPSCGYYDSTICAEKPTGHVWPVR